MATFNGERFLAEQLASLAVQTHLPLELVVVDDCSTDGTVSILERFASDAPFPVRLIANERSLGHGDTFFRALGVCSAELVAFCDQDDVWRADKLSRCAEVFARDATTSLLVHAGRVVDEDLQPTSVRVPDIGRSRSVAGHRLGPLFVERGFAMVIPTWLRDVHDVTQRPRAFRRVEDRPMDHDEWACFLAPALGPVAFLAEELASHRRHGDNFSIMEAPGRPVPGPLRRVRTSDANLTVVRPALGGDRGVAGLFDVEVKVRAYRMVAQQQRDAADYLRRLTSESEHVARAGGAVGVQNRAALYERSANVLDGRAAAVGWAGSRATRVARVVRLALTGAYGARRRGGIGPMSFPLDVAVAVAHRSPSSTSP